MLRKPKTYRSERYKAFVRTLPCCVCRSTENIEAAHTEGGAKAIKGPDTRTVPMCPYCHKEREHREGVKTFEKRYNIDLKVEVIRTLEKYVQAHERGA